MTAKDLKEIIKKLDFAENRKMNYSEFLAATINLKEYLSHDRLQSIFN